MELFFKIATPVLIALLIWWQHRYSGKAAEPTPSPTTLRESIQSKEPLVNRLYELCDAVGPFLNQAANPPELLSHEAFRTGVTILEGEPFSTQDLMDFYNGDNFLLACMALSALERRPAEDEDPTETILRTIGTVAPWTRWFALRAISAQGRPPLVGRVLAVIDPDWENRYGVLFLREFLELRFAAGEPPEFGPAILDLNEQQLAFIESMLDRIGPDVTRDLKEDLLARQKLKIDVDLFSSMGRVWERDPDGGIVSHDILQTQTDQLLSMIERDRRRPILIVGPPGAGKTTLIRSAAHRLQEKGWTIFETSPSELIAGQMLIGMIEDRLKNILDNLRKGKRVLWVIPSFHELMWQGRSMNNPVSILDRLLPHIELGDLCIAGETQPSGYNNLLRRFPRLNSTFEILLVEPLPDIETLDLSRNVARNLENSHGLPAMPEEVLPEALKLARQYLGRDSSPGHVLNLLKRTVETLTVAEKSGEPVSSRDLLHTLSDLTGLPSVILDERESLDLGTLREFFDVRVLGQPEAVDCLVDRVAMIKAGLTDPTRPLGVFLFAGPTGTGKTELAKALAEFLFGSPDRMLRFDMSEFQTNDSLSRILGDPTHDHEQEPLVDRIRNQPFAVVLLDEFEKAHERIWDVFLQLFDDGRLTDRRGNTADFRHAIVIMTTNLGSQYGRHIGFGPQPEPDTQPTIEKEFKREFLNRIDRIVVFRALNRSVMREILMKELDDALDRRGLRSRQWAVEWEPSAIDFLLSRGFTDDLGARPLKRSIERYLLSPLATTIVDHQFPEGDQFLFVRSDGSAIDVAFVDPDEPEEVPESEVEPAREVEEPLRVRGIALSPRGEPRELALLKERYGVMREKVGDKTWTEQKLSFMEAMNDPVFWESNERFSVLGKAEYMDRIEEGLRTAGSLLDRLSGGEDRKRDKFSISIIRRVAQRIYLVEAACRGLEEGEPYDAFVSIEAARHRASHAGIAETFAKKLQIMYTQWAKHREMQCTLLVEEPGGTDGPFRAILAISGFAAYPILKSEQGIHEMEVPGQRGSSFHVKAEVQITPQPDEPVNDPQKNLLALAEASFPTIDSSKRPVVRRYREEPSPLVRDSVRKFRTGRIDVVWRGDFDLL